MISRKPPAILLQTLAFNVEKYIRECIDSVLGQTFSDFEWVILDNGSTDETSRILEEYSQKDSRIKLYRNERNKYVYNDPWNPEFVDFFYNHQAEYWCVVDSDDYIHPDFLKELYLVATKHDADIAVGGTTFFDDEDLTAQGYRCPPNFFTNDSTSIADMLPQVYGCFRPIWGKLFKHSIIQKQWDYRLTEEPLVLLNAGDTLFCLDCLRFANTIVGIDMPLYFYRVRGNSFYSSQLDNSRYLDYISIFKESSKMLQSWGKLNDFNQFFLASVLMESLKDCAKVAANAKSASIEERFVVIETILSDDLVYEVLQKNGLWNNMIGDLQDIIEQIVSDIAEIDIPVAMKHYSFRLSSSIKLASSVGFNKQSVFLLYLSSICDPNNSHHIGSSLLFPFLNLIEAYFHDDLKNSGVSSEFLASQPELLREILNGNTEKAAALCDQSEANSSFDVVKQVVINLAPTLQNNEIEQTKQRIVLSLDDENYETAASLLLEVMSILPLDLEALYYKLYLLTLHGDHVSALETAIILIMFYPAEVNALTLAALAFVNAGLQKEAKAIYQSALDLCRDEEQRKRIAADMNLL